MENQIYERDYRQAKERKRQVLQSTDFDVIGELKLSLIHISEPTRH